ncbi:MAG TPA: hypothetical protein VH234_04285 [Candidatus Saccharimonadales bacterium]|nr:hypothetical protein [Candidatus Saccharimonadales bacterium]
MGAQAAIHASGVHASGISYASEVPPVGRPNQQTDFPNYSG